MTMLDHGTTTRRRRRAGTPAAPPHPPARIIPRGPLGCGPPFAPRPTTPGPRPGRGPSALCTASNINSSSTTRRRPPLSDAHTFPHRPQNEAKCPDGPCEFKQANQRTRASPVLVFCPPPLNSSHYSKSTSRSRAVFSAGQSTWVSIYRPHGGAKHLPRPP